MAKSTKKRRNRHAFRERADGPMQRLHMDLMGKFKHASLGGAYHVLVIVDDYSRYTEVYTLQRKNEAVHRFKEFVATHYPQGMYPKSITVPFLKNSPFHWTSRKVFGQRRPRSTLWVPSGPMDAPNDREAPGANPDGLHCGPAR